MRALIIGGRFLTHGLTEIVATCSGLCIRAPISRLPIESRRHRCGSVPRGRGPRGAISPPDGAPLAGADNAGAASGAAAERVRHGRDQARAGPSSRAPAQVMVLVDETPECDPRCISRCAGRAARRPVVMLGGGRAARDDEWLGVGDAIAGRGRGRDASRAWRGWQRSARGGRRRPRARRAQRRARRRDSCARRGGRGIAFLVLAAAAGSDGRGRSSPRSRRAPPPAASRCGVIVPGGLSEAEITALAG